MRMKFWIKSVGFTGLALWIKNVYIEIGYSHNTHKLQFNYLD